MKKLVLIRHAKALNSDVITADIDRPLTQRGYSDAYSVCQQLKETGLIPDLIIASPAIRTYSTALIFARWFNYALEKISLRKELFEASAEVYWDTLNSLDKDINTVFVVGHNPTISEAASFLSSGKIFDLSTSTAVIFTSGTDKWSGFQNNSTFEAELHSKDRE